MSGEELDLPVAAYGVEDENGKVISASEHFEGPEVAVTSNEEWSYIKFCKIVEAEKAIQQARQEARQQERQKILDILNKQLRLQRNLLNELEEEVDES